LQQEEYLRDLLELVLQGSVRALAPPNISLGGVKITRNLVKAHLIVIDSNSPSSFTTLAGRCGSISDDRQTLTLVTTVKRKRIERKEIVLDILGHGTITLGNLGPVTLTIISDPMVDIENWVDDDDELEQRMLANADYGIGEVVTDRSLESFFLMNPGKRKKVKAFMDKYVWPNTLWSWCCCLLALSLTHTFRLAKQWKKQDGRHETLSHQDHREQLLQFINKTASWVCVVQYNSSHSSLVLLMRVCMCRLSRIHFGPTHN
jgi:hypothetical protein